MERKKERKMDGKTEMGKEITKKNVPYYFPQQLH